MFDVLNYWILMYPHSTVHKNAYAPHPPHPKSRFKVKSMQHAHRHPWLSIIFIIIFMLFYWNKLNSIIYKKSNQTKKLSSWKYRNNCKIIYSNQKRLPSIIYLNLVQFQVKNWNTNKITFAFNNCRTTARKDTYRFSTSLIFLITIRWASSLFISFTFVVVLLLSYFIHLHIYLHFIACLA